MVQKNRSRPVATGTASKIQSIESPSTLPEHAALVTGVYVAVDRATMDGLDASLGLYMLTPAGEVK